MATTVLTRDQNRAVASDTCSTVSLFHSDAPAETVEMGVADGALSLILDMLSDISADRGSYALREAYSNAYDAVVATGDMSRRIDVVVPDPEQCDSESLAAKVAAAEGLPSAAAAPVAYVEDFGCGMTPDDVRRYFLQYGGSKKRADADMVGSKGLGAKAPLAVSDTFELSTRRGGVETVARVTRDGDRSSADLEVRQTSLPDGTRVSFPVGDPQTLRSMRECARRLAEWNTAANLYVNGERAEGRLGLRCYCGEVPVGVGADGAEVRFPMWYVGAEAGIAETGCMPVTVVVGGYPYEVPDGSSRRSYGPGSAGIVVVGDPGYLNFDPSRDHVRNDDAAARFAAACRDGLREAGVKGWLRNTLAACRAEHDFPGAVDALRELPRKSLGRDVEPSRVAGGWSFETGAGDFVLSDADLGMGGVCLAEPWAESGFMCLVHEKQSASAHAFQSGWEGGKWVSRTSKEQALSLDASTGPLALAAAPGSRRRLRAVVVTGCDAEGFAALAKRMYAVERHFNSGKNASTCQRWAILATPDADWSPSPEQEAALGSLLMSHVVAHADLVAALDADRAAGRRGGGGRELRCVDVDVARGGGLQGALAFAESLSCGVPRDLSEDPLGEGDVVLLVDDQTKQAAAEARLSAAAVLSRTLWDGVGRVSVLYNARKADLAWIAASGARVLDDARTSAGRAVPGSTMVGSLPRGCRVGDEGWSLPTSAALTDDDAAWARSLGVGLPDVDLGDPRLALAADEGALPDGVAAALSAALDLRDAAASLPTWFSHRLAAWSRGRLDPFGDARLSYPELDAVGAAVSALDAAGAPSPLPMRPTRDGQSPAVCAALAAMYAAILSEADGAQ